MEIIGQMIVFFLIMFIGYLAARKKMMNETACKALSAIVVNIANPALILTSVTGEYQRISNSEIASAFFVIILMFAMLIAVGYIISKLMKVNNSKEDMYNGMTVFSNIGFMGFPIIEVAYGKQGLLYGSLVSLVFNVLMYTYGMTKLSATKHEDKPRKLNIKGLFNLGILACLVSLTFFLANISINVSYLEKTIDMLANLTAPLSMMIIGASFAEIDIGSIFTDVKMIIYSLARQFVIPLLIGIVLLQFTKNATFLGVLSIMLATPVASMCAMVAQTSNGEYELASKTIAFTTILSLISIPVMNHILTSIAGY